MSWSGPPARFLDPQPGLGQVKDLPAGHKTALSRKRAPTPAAMGRLVPMNQVGLLDHFQSLTGMARLSAGPLSRLFGKGWLDEGLLFITIRSGGLMGVGRGLGQPGA